MTKHQTNRPLISVIIPFYNVEFFAARCIQSVLDQTYTNFELFLMDDGSTDGTGHICDQFAQQDSRVCVFHTPNRGISAARNLGIAKSTGEYISFIDGDDMVSSDYLEYLYQALKQHGTEISTCQSATVDYDPNTHTLSEPKIPTLDTSSFVATDQEALDLMLQGKYNLINAMMKLYARRLFDDIHYPVGQLYEDTNTTYKLFMAAGQIAVGNAPKYIYSVRPNSITHAPFSEADVDILTAVDTSCAAIIKKYPQLKNSAMMRQVVLRILLFDKMIRAGYTGKTYQETVDFFRQHSAQIDTSSSLGRQTKRVATFIAQDPEAYAKIHRIFQ